MLELMEHGEHRIAIAKLANKYVMPETKINPNTWFSKDSISVLKAAWDNADGDIGKYVGNVFENLGGRDCKTIKNFKDVNWDKVQWNNHNSWKKIFWDNVGFVDVDEKMKTKDGIVSTMTQLIKDKTITRKDRC